jgi:hypothetical protein
MPPVLDIGRVWVELGLNSIQSVIIMIEAGGHRNAQISDTPEEQGLWDPGAGCRESSSMALARTE